jgi:hypothetical protein
VKNRQPGSGLAAIAHTNPTASAYILSHINPFERFFGGNDYYNNQQQEKAKRQESFHFLNRVIYQETGDSKNWKESSYILILYWERVPTIHNDHLPTDHGSRR